MWLTTGNMAAFGPLLQRPVRKAILLSHLSIQLSVVCKKPFVICSFPLTKL